MPAVIAEPLTRHQVRQLDRRAIEEFGIPGVLLMDAAAAAVVDAVLEELGAHSGPVLIVCGPGNNGGDGFAAARRLHDLGVPVRIAFVADERRLGGEARTYWVVCGRLDIPILPIARDGILDRRTLGTECAGASLLVDALLGTGLVGPARGPTADAIDVLNASGRPILSVDIPSGLDCDTGAAPGAVIRATRTVTFVGPKAGFAAPSAQPYLGRLTAAPIGIPRSLVLEHNRLSARSEAS